MKALLVFGLLTSIAMAQNTKGPGFPPSTLPCSASQLTQTYLDTTNNLTYTCTNISGVGYIWKLGQSPVFPVVSAPSGSCTAGIPNQQVISTGIQYSCQGGTWTAFGSGGGGSSVWSALTNPTGNLALTQGANLSSFANTIPFTPQASFASPWQYTNGLNFGTEWNIIYSSYMPNAYPSDMFDVGLTVPSNSTVFSSNAIGAFVNCSQPTGLHYCVGLYGQAIVGATGSQASAINGNASDNGVAGLVMPGEFNSQVSNTSTTGRTLYIQANLGSNTQYDGIDILTGTGHYRYGVDSDAPIRAPSYQPLTIYSVAGTALPTCSGVSYNGTQLPVSDLATTTAGAVYTGSGSVSGIVACGKNSSASYSWYVVGAATFGGAPTTMTDSFIGSVGPLQAHTADTGQSWTEFMTGPWGGGLTLNGSQSLTLAAVSPTISAYYASLVPGSADYTVTEGCTLGAAGSTWCQAMGRLASLGASNFTGYSCLFAQGGGLSLYRWDTGPTAVQIGTTYAGVTGGTHTVALVMVGTALKCQLDSSDVAGPSGTDATYSAAGKAGLALSGNIVSGYLINHPFTVQ